jgi:hypothetical protein
MSIDGLLVGVLAIAIGAAWAFYGLSAFTVLLPLFAFAFGVLVGAQLGQDAFGEGFFSTVLSWVVGIVFGLILASVSFFWYYAAVTLAAGALGYAFGVGFANALDIDSSLLGSVVGLVIGAVLAIATFAAGVPAFLVITFSAISGAAGVVNGGLILLGRIKVADLHSGLLGGLLSDGTIAVVAWILIAVVAIWYQLRKVSDTSVAIRREAYRF